MQAHVDAQARGVEAQLRSFLDPKDGRLMQRLDGLLKDNGELARMLQQHTGPGSKLQTTMMAAIAPLLNRLNPTEQDGVVLMIKRQVEQVLGASQAAVKDALDPMVEKSAANRFLGRVRGERLPPPPQHSKNRGYPRQRCNSCLSVVGPELCAVEHDHPSQHRAREARRA